MRSLPNGHLEPRYISFLVGSSLNFPGGCAFEKELHGLFQVIARFHDGIALAGDVQLRTEGHIAIAFSVNDSGQVMIHKNSPVGDLGLSPAIFLELAIERTLADTQKPRRFFAVAAGELQGLGDSMPLDLLKRLADQR